MTFWRRHGLALIPCSASHLVRQLEETNEQLATLSNDPATLSQSMLRAIQRHREIFQDSVRELNRTKVRNVHSS